MYGRGHVGAALCCYAPMGAALGAVGEVGLAVGGTVLAATVSSLPDADEYLPMTHRGITHTVWFVLGVTALAAAAGGVVGAAAGRPGLVAVTAAGAVAISLGSHLLADSLTPMGISPLYPLSSRHYTFDVTPSADPRANVTLLGVGLLATVLWQWAVLV